MRFTITPLGSAGGVTVDHVVGRVVRYLAPALGPPSSPKEEVMPAGPSRYYADTTTEPGRWTGRGAAAAGLVGLVDPKDFARVLAGRDPRTGNRLITAQGSAGRRPTLGLGAETRRGHDGRALYDERDAAAVLGLTQEETARLLEVGQWLAVLGLLAFLTGGGSPEVPEQPEGSYLVPFVDAEGKRWVSEAELSRCEAARAKGPPAEAIELAGDSDDPFSLAKAARVASVTSRYLRSLCRRYEHHRPEIEGALAEGRRPRQAYVVAHRGIKGQWRIRRRDLVEFLRRRTPPAVRVGYDLTLTTEKSLGVLALLSGPETRNEVLNAIRAGNDVGLAYLEDQAASARAKGERVAVQGWTAASFQHLTSRALDPFPHHHNVVANTVVDEEGTRRALNARGLYHHAPEASALATAEMRWRLSSSLGVRWRQRPSGGWEIDGIGDEVLREFSQRRNEIDEALEELEAAIGRGSTLAELQGAVLATRPVKQHAHADGLVERWWQRARRVGLTPRRLARCLHRCSGPPPEPDPQTLFATLASPEGLCARSSVFTRADVVAALADLPVPTGRGPAQPLLVPAAHLGQLADDFLASEHVVELHPPPEVRRPLGRLGRERIFSTPEILAVQRYVLDTYQAGLCRQAAVAPPGLVEQVLTRHPMLSDEQRELVRAFCTSGNRVQCAIGRAGAGKTTAMRAAAECWQAAGYRVLGLAVKGEAARLLGAATGISTETVAWYLAAPWTPATSRTQRTVLLVDEASTLSDRDLNQLLRLATATETVVRLLGDPAQHGAVAAGGMFRVLCERYPNQTPELSQSHRVGHPEDRAAADALREGRIDEALDLLDTAGHLHLVEGDHEVHLDLLRRWWEERCVGRHHPMVDRRNQTRHALNRLAHRLLQVAGEVGRDEIRVAGDRGFSVGDQVVARQAARHLHVEGDRQAYLRNGAIGTVMALHPARSRPGDRISVCFDGIGTIVLPRSFFDQHRLPSGRVDVGLDHAYAVTSYAVQGATYDVSTSRLDERASRAEAYVDITRGRNANHLYLSRSPDLLDGEALPKAPPPPLDQSVTSRLQRSSPEVTAIELDPEALLRHETPARAPVGL